MFAGDPKLGKSFVTIFLAAAVSRGGPCLRISTLPRPARWSSCRRRTIRANDQTSPRMGRC